MRAGLLALCILLTGCAGPRNLIADGLGYVECSEVQQPVFTETAHPDIASVREVCGPNVAGCAIYNKWMCDIHYEISDGLTRRHECTHCVRGAFHP